MNYTSVPINISFKEGTSTLVTKSNTAYLRQSTENFMDSRVFLRFMYPAALQLSSPVAQFTPDLIRGTLVLSVHYAAKNYFSFCTKHATGSHATHKALQ